MRPFFSRSFFAFVLAACLSSKPVVEESIAADADDADSTRDPPTIEIYAGPASGLYFHVALAVADYCPSANEDSYRCVVVETAGSEQNYEALAAASEANRPALALLQEDTLRRNSESLGAGSIRPRLGLYPEFMLMLVRADSDINSAEDLADRRVHAGVKGSGMRASAKALSGLLFPDGPEMRFVEDMRIGKALVALRNNQLDAILRVVGLPDSTGESFVRRFPDVTLRRLKLDDAIYRSLLPYKRRPLPADAYGQGNTNSDALEFPSVMAVLATNGESTGPRARSRLIADRVLKDIAAFRARHPALRAAASYVGPEAVMQPTGATASQARAPTQEQTAVPGQARVVVEVSDYFPKGDLLIIPFDHRGVNMEGSGALAAETVRNLSNLLQSSGDWRSVSELDRDPDIDQLQGVSYLLTGQLRAQPGRDNELTLEVRLERAEQAPSRRLSLWSDTVAVDIWPPDTGPVGEARRLAFEVAGRISNRYGIVKASRNGIKLPTSCLNSLARLHRTRDAVKYLGEAKSCVDLACDGRQACDSVLNSVRALLRIEQYRHDGNPAQLLEAETLLLAGQNGTESHPLTVEARALRAFYDRDDVLFESLASQALARNFDDATTRGMIGIHRILIGNDDVGLSEVNFALRLDPTLPDWMRLARFVAEYARTSDVDRLRGIYREPRRLDPGPLSILYRVLVCGAAKLENGNLQVSNGDCTDIDELIRELQEAWPDTRSTADIARRLERLRLSPTRIGWLVSHLNAVDFDAALSSP